MTSGDPTKGSLKYHFRQFIESLSFGGINSEIASTASRNCEKILDQISTKPSVEVYLKNFLINDPGILEHSYLTAYFTAIIVQNIAWSSERTTEIAIYSSFIHDLGMHHLPAEVLSKPIETYSSEELKVYQSHCQKSADLIRKWHLPESVAQVALQHHEMIDGRGYPYSTTGNQIYPLAKIVSLANSFSEFFMNEKLPVVQSLKAFASNRQTAEQYDGDALRGLIKGFIKGK